MGRLVGVKYFFTTAANENEKENARKLRHAKKEVDEASEDVSTDSGEYVNIVSEEQVAAVRRLQQQFDDRIIRRSRDSKAPEGNNLIDLPPCEDITVHLHLTEREAKIIDALEKVAKEK